MVLPACLVLGQGGCELQNCHLWTRCSQRWVSFQVLKEVDDDLNMGV